MTMLEHKDYHQDAYGLELKLNSEIKILRNNLKDEYQHCSTALGVLVKKRIIYRPASEPFEVLALLHASDPQLGYWYLHAHYNEQKSCYIIAVVRSIQFIDAPLIKLAFDRFNYWIKERGYYTLPYYVSDITDERIAKLPCNISGQYSYYETINLDEVFIYIHDIISNFAVPFQFPLTKYSDITEDLLPEYEFSENHKLTEIYAKPKKLKDNIFQPFPLSHGIDDEYMCCLLDQRKLLECLLAPSGTISNINADA